jgi:cell division protein FtsL
MTTALKKKNISESNLVGGAAWFVLLLVLNVVSALFIVFSTHELRQIHMKIDEAQRNETRELARNSRLLLEKSSLASLNEVESIALEELGMLFPKNPGKVSQ